MPLKTINHHGGTCHSHGSDSKVNVLDLNYRTVDIDNLYVLDSSFFPSIGVRNPTTLTTSAEEYTQGLDEHLLGLRLNISKTR